MTTELDCSVGISPPEAGYGTITTATKFLEFTDETFDWSPSFLQGQGLRVGSRVVRSARRSTGKQLVVGDLTMEAPSKGLGALLQAVLGAVTTTQRGATGVYQQNHTPATTDPLNSYTIQKGIPPVGGGTTLAHTFAGMMCDSIQFACANNDILTVKTSWNGKSVDTATAYAAPSYPTPIELLTFVQGSIAIGGAVTPPTTTAIATGGTAVADIRDFNLTWSNALDDAGFNLGGAGKRSRKQVVGLSAVTGQLTAEFDAATLRDAYLNQTDLALLLTFVGASNIGSGADHPNLQIWVPNIRLEGELPKVSSGGVVRTQSIGFTGFDNLSNPPITVVYASTDATP